MNVTIRDLDAAVFRRFKAKAVEEGMKLGEALTQAMELWIRQRETKPRIRLSEIKPFDWVEETERVSIEIDRTIYGEGR
jgi:hypothetical protein